MESAVSTIATPAILVAVAAAAVYYTNGCAGTKANKKPAAVKVGKDTKKTAAVATTDAAVAVEDVEEANIDDFFPEKAKKTKAPKKAAKQAKKIDVARIFKTANVEEEEEDFATLVDNSKKAALEGLKAPKVAPKPAAAELAKPAVVEEKKPEAPKKPLTEVEKLKMRIQELEDAANGKKKAPAKAAGGDKFNQPPVLTKAQQEEQQKMLEKIEREQAKWVEVSSGKREKKEKKPEIQLLDLNGMIDHVVVTQADRRAIAGEGGAVMKQIEELCRVKVTLPPRPLTKVEHPEKVQMSIELEGDEANVNRAKKIIQDLAHKGFSQELTPDTTEVRLRIKPEERFKIIGEKGAYINKITEKTGVILTIPRKDETGDAAGIITIRGDAAQVAEAKEAIRALVLHGFSSLTHEDWERISVPFPANARRYLLVSYSKDGPLIHKIQDLSGCKVSFPADQDNQVSIVGPSKNVYKAADLLKTVSDKLAQPVADVWLPGFEGSDFSKNELW